MKKVVILGYYGFGNSGDEAILTTIVRDLRKADPNIHITVMSQNPDATSREHQVKAIGRMNIFQIIRNIKGCDLFVSGGGSLLQDITSTRSLYYYLFIIRMALFFGRKVILYANGIGPINHESNREQVKKVIDRVNVITLREEDSWKLLKDIGIKSPYIQVTADPVLTYESADNCRIEAIFKQENIPMDQGLVGINIRKWKHSVNLEEEVARAADFIFEQQGLRSVFIPMFEEDLQISQQIASRMKHPAYVLQKQYKPDELIGIIGRMKLIIAMRLHTLIYASINSIPMIGLVYDPKVVGYLEYVKQFSAGDVCSLKAESINKQVDLIIEQYDQIRAALIKTTEELKNKAKNNAQIAMDLLK
ncbi:MAG: csaB [Clostridia bacterium]|jgi:polysaccharide pyruvyl transferase CsaB|nr:csaB [Clostridia bacterium]